jgi:hypothetical protein
MADERRKIDLRAAREARGAASKTPVDLTVPDPAKPDEDLAYELPPELPLAFIELIYSDRIVEAFETLVGDRAEELVRALNFEDVEDFADLVTEAYGIEGGLGNLPASGASS